MVYNLSFMETSNTLYDVVIGVDGIVSGLISGLLLFTLFIVVMGSFSDRNYNNLVLMSAFVTSLVATLLFVLGIAGTIHLIVPLIVLFVAIIMKVWVGD